MFYTHHFAAAITLISISDALVVQPAQLIDASQSVALPLQFSAVATSASALLPTSSGFSVPNATFISTSNQYNDSAIRSYCDAKMYGAPSLPSCLDVYTQLNENDTYAEFGDRTRGVYEYPLPYRFTSNDGTCVIDIELFSRAYQDRATMTQMRSAVLELMDDCVFDKQAGGVATGLGQSGNLAVTIQKYSPDVHCQGSMLRSPDIRECQELLGLMPTSTDEQVFGQQGDPGVEVELPFDLAERTGKCGFYFVSHGGAQKGNWHDLWQAATAVWGMCARNSAQGIAFVGNAQQSIDVAMYRPPENSLTLNSTIGGLLDAVG